MFVHALVKQLDCPLNSYLTAIDKVPVVIVLSPWYNIFTGDYPDNQSTNPPLIFCPQGMALVFAPLRGETLRLFCQLAQQAGLCVSQHQQYDAQVWDVHLKVGNMSKTLSMTPQH